MNSERKVPMAGERHIDIFNVERKIVGVDHPYSDGGFSVVLDDGVGYDAYWSEKDQCWYYDPAQAL